MPEPPTKLAIARCAAAALLWASVAAASAAQFAHPGGPEPANLDEVFATLQSDPHDLELLVSYGTSKGGSAGHLALAIRDEPAGDDQVYSANFYADRDPKHEKERHTGDLMVRIPKKEYLYGTRSSLGAKASFGLDYGEVYKRSVIGIRVAGVPAREKATLAAFFARLNADYHRRAPKAEYHGDEIRYGYLELNCAKTIGAAFKHGAGYADLEVKGSAVLSGLKAVAAVNANIPTEMALKLLEAWNARGYGMHVVFYRKYEGSDYVDPLEEEKIAFRDLPDRFPSVLSRDFRKEQGQYQDYDNLYAMYLFHNLARHGVRVDGRTQRLEVRKAPLGLPYKEAVKRAAQSASADSRGFLRRLPFLREGQEIGDEFP